MKPPQTLRNEVSKLQTTHKLSKFHGFVINSLRKLLCNVMQLEQKIQHVMSSLQSGFIPFKKESQD